MASISRILHWLDGTVGTRCVGEARIDERIAAYIAESEGNCIFGLCSCMGGSRSCHLASSHKYKSSRQELQQLWLLVKTSDSAIYCIQQATVVCGFADIDTCMLL